MTVVTVRSVTPRLTLLSVFFQLSMSVFGRTWHIRQKIRSRDVGDLSFRILPSGFKQFKADSRAGISVFTVPKP